MFRFEHLEIWKESINLSKEIYGLVKKFPKEELFALGDQLRRAAVSISANIAEGSGSNSNKDFSNFLGIAIKSLFEVVSLITISKDNTYISNKEFDAMHNKAELLAKRIQALRNTLK